MSQHPRRLPKGLIPALGLAAMIACAIIGLGLWKQSEYYLDARSQSAENARRTDYEFRYRCTPKAPLEEYNCALEQHREKRSYERDELDLYAQKTSAFWTSVMGSAAVIGLLLSTVGVWLVYTTFRETKKQVEVGRAAVEAAIVPTQVRVHFDGDPRPNYGRDTVNVSLRNVGQSAATDVVIFGRYEFITDQGVVAAGQLMRTAVLDVTVDHGRGHDLPAEITFSHSQMVQALRAGGIALEVTITCEYTTRFGERKAERCLFRQDTLHGMGEQFIEAQPPRVHCQQVKAGEQPQ